MAYTTITDPSAYFHTQLYTGNATDGVNITNDANAGNFKPDWIWIKNRTGGADWHDLTDSTRGVTKSLFSNTTSAESTQTGAVQAFLTDGFTIGDNTQVNRNANNYAAWQWKANGATTTSNTDGSITSTVQANTTAGFSIVTYTGTGSTATVGHGLGAVPKMIIVKKRSGNADWRVYHESLNNTHVIYLNTTQASETGSDVWNNTSPTSSVFTVNTNGGVNASSATYVAYCFAEKQGYSKFGGYTGNGNSNGPFVYTGFKPAWVMVKNTAGTTNWNMYDNKRSTFNTVDDILMANSSDAESAVSGKAIDFLSNGFKLRGSDNETNDNGDVHIYMAFAQNPFVAINGIPTTAR